MAIVWGCDSPDATPTDAPLRDSTLQDAMNDVAIDGTPDAPVSSRCKP